MSKLPTLPYLFVWYLSLTRRRPADRSTDPVSIYSFR